MLAPNHYHHAVALEVQPLCTTNRLFAMPTRNEPANSCKRSLKLACASLAAIACLICASAHAGSISVDFAESDVVNDMYVVNATFDFAFSDDALAAMQSGVALFIDVDFKIKRQRRYVWDPKILSLSRRYQIERHALTERYIITDLVTDERRTHDTIDAAIDDLGRIHAVPITPADQLDPNESYRFAVRSRLDLESLPAPLRPIAYISPSWRMSSGWFEWNPNQ